jgi:hypothetical protein
MKALPTSAPQRCYLLLLLCLAGCQPAARVWDGDVVISERSISQSLRQLVAIEGSLIVRDARFKAFDLPALRTVSGDVIIQGNERLQSLSGLRKLAWIGGSLVVEGNGRLLDLSGLEELSVIRGSLTISRNGILCSLGGLEGLAMVGGNITIADNYGLDLEEEQSFLDRLEQRGWIRPRKLEWVKENLHGAIFAHEPAIVLDLRAGLKEHARRQRQLALASEGSTTRRSLLPDDNPCP